MLCEVQSDLSRIWTRVAVSISYDDNHYTTGTSNNHNKEIIKEFHDRTNNNNNNDNKRETESLIIAAQDNAIRTNHIKARIDKTQQNM